MDAPAGGQSITLSSTYSYKVPGLEGDALRQLERMTVELFGRTASGSHAYLEVHFANVPGAGWTPVRWRAATNRSSAGDPPFKPVY
jgi:hypothetical protein